MMLLSGMTPSGLRARGVLRFRVSCGKEYEGVATLTLLGVDRALGLEHLLWNEEGRRYQSRNQP